MAKPVRAKLVGKHGTETMEVDAGIGVIIHQDTRAESQVRTFVFRRFEHQREAGRMVAVFECSCEGGEIGS
jgi:hypothetical protein